MSLDNQFNIIYEKLQQLLKQHHKLKRENEQLKKELQEQKDSELQAQQKMEYLQQQISILKLAGGDMNEADKKEFEKKINNYIKEIDKCIAFLSQ
jgi:cell division septum initiation protein DivIVA